MHRPRLHRYYAKLRYSFGFEFRLGLGFAHLVTSMVGAGIAALALACLWRHDAVVRLLLKSRARPEQRDHGGQSLGLLFEDCSVLWVLLKMHT